MKLAAIFFDKIIPVYQSHKIPESLLFKGPIDSSRFDELLKKDAKRFRNSDIGLLNETILPSYFENRTQFQLEDLEDLISTVFEEGRLKVTNLKILDVTKQITSKSNIGIPIFNESILLNRLLEDYKVNSNHDKVELQILNAPIVNTENLDWEQISEVKKDKDFAIKVKRFGLFINKNYQGKDISFIVDDLSIQIEDYKNACKKHGIELVNGSLKSLANSKSFFGTLGLVLCSILFKTPEVALVSGAIGGVLEAAKLNITIKEINDRFNSFTKEAPIALILKLDELNKAHNMR